MKKLLSLTIPFMLLSNLLFAQCGDSTNTFSFTYGGKNYELVKIKNTWIGAAGCAVYKGGYLVHIDDSNEQNAVMNGIIASGFPYNYNPISDGGGTSYVWIGATDKLTEGTWIWDGNNDEKGYNFWNGQGSAGSNNGAVVTGKYANWGGRKAGKFNEPDDYGSSQDAAAIALAGWPFGTTLLGSAGEWNDIDIYNQNYFIIEYGSITGLTEPKSFKEIVVFPNPNKGSVNLISERKINHYSIYDMLGKIKIENQLIEETSQEIFLKELNSGIYILEVEYIDSNIEKLKIIKE